MERSTIKAPGKGPFLLVAIMDDCFSATTVFIVSLNNGGAIEGLPLFDHRGTIPTPFTIVFPVTLTNGYANTN